jgi:hypothetical protein
VNDPEGRQPFHASVPTQVPTDWVFACESLGARQAQTSSASSWRWFDKGTRDACSARRVVLSSARRAELEDFIGRIYICSSLQVFLDLLLVQWEAGEGEKWTRMRNRYKGR